MTKYKFTVTVEHEEEDQGLGAIEAYNRVSDLLTAPLGDGPGQGWADLFDKPKIEHADDPKDDEGGFAGSVDAFFEKFDARIERIEERASVWFDGAADRPRKDHEVRWRARADDNMVLIIPDNTELAETIRVFIDDKGRPGGREVLKFADRLNRLLMELQR